MVLKSLDRKTEIQTWLNDKYLCEIRIYLLTVRTVQERDERKTIHE